MALLCWKCGSSLRDVPWPLSRLSRCLECHADLYCCRMCRKYEPKYISKCGDDRADPPQNKQGANFCDWFSPNPNAYSGKEKSLENQARQNLAALFGGASAGGQGQLAGDAKRCEAGAELEKQSSEQPAEDSRSRTQRALEEARKLFDPEQ